jgi:hypothetical protein
MPQKQKALHTCEYHVLRYTPNLVRDEWVNIGVVIHDPEEKRAGVRLLASEGDFVRVRRLQPGADENLLRALEGDLEKQFEENAADLPGLIAKLGDALSNAVQLSAHKGVLTEDMDAELERLYRDHVEPPHPRAGAAQTATRSGIRARMTEVFRTAGILRKMTRSLRVDEFTYPGDPLRMDFGYQRNGTQGFLQALALAKDPAQAKVLAYTADSIRAKAAASEFYAITEVEPRAENARHKFVSGLLAEKGITVLSMTRLPDLAHRLGPTLR